MSEWALKLRENCTKKFQKFDELDDETVLKTIGEMMKKHNNLKIGLRKIKG